MQNIIDQFHENGFARIQDGLITSEEFLQLKSVICRLETNRIIDINSQILQNLNDAIFLDETIEKFACNPKILALIEGLLGTAVELQHSKMINKYLSQGVASNVKWHQDYPFFPHTNYDLIALALHFDDEPDEAGPLDFLVGSHKFGIFPHNDPNTGEFMYEITDKNFSPRNYESVRLNCKSGDITIHHGNTIHASSPNKGVVRRVLYLQYRAIDALQFAGVVWRCTGYNPYRNPVLKTHARFIDGTRIEVRSGGKLFDKFGVLAPDETGKKSISF